MSTPDTSIYIVGTNRTWQIRAKTLKLILTSTVLLLIGLAAALLYQSIWHLQVVGGWEERYAAENERNEKMRSVIEDLPELPGRKSRNCRVGFQGGFAGGLQVVWTPLSCS